MHKSSYYNLIFERKHDIVLYNTFTGILLLLNNYKVENISSILINPDLYCEKPIFNILIENGFVIEDKINEYNIIKANFWKEKYISKTMYSMICTTFNCNFSCSYCFEGCGKKIGNEKSNMQPKVVEAVYKLIKRKINEIEKMELFWFGGEPLINTAPIFYLSNKIFELCEKNSINCNLQIISNGYLLDKSMALLLSENHIGAAQITLDGSRKYHDKRRFINNKRPTFDVIVKNIVSWQNVIQPRIRINTDKNNIDSLFELIDELELYGVNNNSLLHFGMVRNFSQNSLGNLELSAYDFRKSIHKVYNYAISKGFNVDYGNSIIPKQTVCNAVKRNTLHIGPNGELWKCFPLIGTDKGLCGTVFDYNGITDDTILYDSFDPFAYDECKKCILLPICFRRCPYEEMCLNVNTKMCDFYKTDEIIERLNIVINTNNKNNNVRKLISISCQEMIL